MNLYTLAIGHLDSPAAEIFASERDALERRLKLAEVSEMQRERIINLFCTGNTDAYEAALNRLESEVDLVCAIEKHEVGVI